VCTRGPEKAYRKACCEQRPYRALSDVARAEGIEIRARRTAQEPVPGYYLCVVDLAWEASRDAWRPEHGPLPVRDRQRVGVQVSRQTGAYL
jgi:hypothetical protein